MSIARHTGYNLLGYFLPLLVTIFTVPIYLKVVGIERYGILALCWAMMGLLGFFSLGLGPAVSRQLALLHSAPPGDRSDLFWSAAALNLLPAIAAGALVLFGASYYFATVDTGPGLQAELALAVPWLAATVALSLIAGLTTGALQGRQWFGALNSLLVAASVATALVPLAVALVWGPDLRNLLIATLGVTLVSLIGQGLVCARAVPLQTPRTISSSALREMVHYGGWVTVTGLLAPILLLIDRFAIGAMIGSAAVSVYVIAHGLVSRVTLVAASFQSAALPRFTAADVSEERRLTTISLAWLLAAMTLLCVVGNMLVAPFFTLWLGESIARSAGPVASILVVGFWAHGVGHLGSTVLMGRGRPDIITKLLLAGAIPYLALLYLLMRQFGLVGAAIAWSIRAAFDLTLFAFARIDRGQVVNLITGAAMVGGSLAIALVLPWRGLVYWGVSAIWAGLALVWAYRLVAPVAARDGIAGFRWPFFDCRD